MRSCSTGRVVIGVCRVDLARPAVDCLRGGADGAAVVVCEGLAVISRLRMDEKTKAYVAKRTVEGHSKLEIIRCLKRYLAREVYYLLNPGTPPGAGRSWLAGRR